MSVGTVQLLLTMNRAKFEKTFLLTHRWVDRLHTQMLYPRREEASCAIQKSDQATSRKYE